MAAFGLSAGCLLTLRRIVFSFQLIQPIGKVMLTSVVAQRDLKDKSCMKLETFVSNKDATIT